MDCDSPDRDTIENLRIVARENPKPIVMFVEDGDGSLAKEAVRAGVSAYIVDGLTSSRVQLSESEAFASMRKLAMQESITIKQVADKILSVASLLGDSF